MKTVQIVGTRDARLVDQPDPKAAGDVAVVKIHVAPMCTEYKAYKAGGHHATLGHEAAGEVVDVAQPGKVKVGDRVVVMPQAPCGRCPLCLAGEYIHCQRCVNILDATGNAAGTATYAQYVLKQDWLLIPIPEGVSYSHASLACCGLGPTFGAMQLMKVDAFDTVLILGMGPVGLGGLINGIYRGARVIAVEPYPYRARLAEAMGAWAVIDPTDGNALARIMDLTGGVGVDKAIDCCGLPSGQRLMIDAVRRKGQACFLAESGEFSLYGSNDMVRKGLTLHGAWHYNLADTPRLMNLIEESPDLLDKQITHTFPMTRVQEAFEIQISGECGKVLLDPWK